MDAPAAAPAAAPAPDAMPPAPAPVGEIRLGQTAVDSGPAQPPPKPGSARERLFSELRKKAKADTSQSSRLSSETEATAPAVTSPEAAAAPSPAGDPTPGSPASDVKPEAGQSTIKGEKNPWKVVDHYKSRLTQAETELAKIKSSPIGEAQRQEYETKLSTLQKRADELENEIRFTNYEKSSEYQTKYVEPYKKAWTRAAKELSEISVRDAAGAERTATVEDLAAIVNLPLGRARAVAEEAFGSFADDVMGYRKEILGLLEAQNSAKEEAKNNSTNRDKERQEQTQKVSADVHKAVTEHWSKFNEEFKNDPKVGKYFQPVEGDQEINSRLEKGFALVDKAYSAPNINDPSLTTEQRSEIVRMHAAVRNRAASWGRMRYEVERSVGRIAELEKELGKYKGSVPGTGGTTHSPVASGAVRVSAKDSVFAALRAKAKQI
jgi:hypothetical protein